MNYEDLFRKGIAFLKSLDYETRREVMARMPDSSAGVVKSALNLSLSREIHEDTRLAQRRARSARPLPITRRSKHGDVPEILGDGSAITIQRKPESVFPEATAALYLLFLDNAADPLAPEKITRAAMMLAQPFESSNQKVDLTLAEGALVGAASQLEQQGYDRDMLSRAVQMILDALSARTGAAVVSKYYFYQPRPIPDPIREARRAYRQAGGPRVDSRPLIQARQEYDDPTLPSGIERFVDSDGATKFRVGEIVFSSLQGAAQFIGGANSQWHAPGQVR